MLQSTPGKLVFGHDIVLNPLSFLTWNISSSRLVSLSLWNAYSREMVFHTLYRGQIDTRLYPLSSYRSLRCTLTFSPPQESSFTSIRHSSSPSPSAVAATSSRTPTRSIPTCSHHCIPTRSPGALSDPSHRYNSDHVAIYCATVFWIRLM